MLRDSAIYVAGKALPGALGFATAMLLTWFLPPEDLGLYGVGMAAVALANNAVFEWLGACVLRWYTTHQNDPAFMPTVLALFACAASTGALLVLGASLLGLTGGHDRLVWLLLFGSLAYGWFEFAARLQICRGRPAHYLCMSLLRNGLILAGCAAVAHLTGSAEATLLAGFAAMAAAGCLFLRPPRPRCWTRFDPALAREFVAFGAPVALTMILSGLATTATPITVGIMAGYEAVGAFAVGMTIVQSTLGVISGGVSSAVYPAAVRAVESGDAPAARAVLAGNCTMLLALLLPAGVGLAMVSPQIAAVFVEPRYHDALARAMPWLAAGAALSGVRATYVEYAFHLGKRTRDLVQVVGGAAVVNLGAGVALIPVWHEIGAAVALCCASGVALVHAAVLARRAYPIPFPVKEACGICLAVAAMAATLWALPVAADGAPGLARQVVCGFVAYAAALGLLAASARGSVQGAALFLSPARSRRATAAHGRRLPPSGGASP